MTKFRSLVGLGLFFLLPTVLLASGLLNQISIFVTGGWQRETLFWALSLGCLAYVTLVEGKPLSSIGIVRPSWKTLAFALVSVVAIRVAGTVALMIYMAMTGHGQPGLKTAMTLGGFPIGLLFLMALRAGVSEEILFRGYTIERLAGLTGSRFAAGAISLLAFTVAHLGTWGDIAFLLPVFVAGLVLTVQYVWRRDLLSNVISHFITDFVGFLLVIAMAHHQIPTG